jgi:hypothetical protein
VQNYGWNKGTVWRFLEGLALISNPIASFIAGHAVVSLIQEYSQFAQLETKQPFWDRFLSNWASNHLAAQEQQIIRDASAKINSALSKSRKVLIVAHSQGNFYMNNVYQQFDQDDRFNIRLLSVATPAAYVGTPGTTFPYVSRGDDFISHLPGSLPATSVVPTSSDFLPFPTNHAFIERYLDDAAVGAIVRSLALTQLKALLAVYDIGIYDKIRGTVHAQILGYPKYAYPSANDFDIDIHVYEPNGNHVYYANQFGAVGQQDVDGNGYAQTIAGIDYYYTETYSICPKDRTKCKDTYHCEPNVPEVGTYFIGVNYYATPADYFKPIDHDPDHVIDDDHHDSRKDWLANVKVDILLLAGPKRLAFTIEMPGPPLGSAGDAGQLVAAIDVTKVDGKPRYVLRRF